MKFREVLALLRRDGWMEARQRGSHIQFTHPTKPGTLHGRGQEEPRGSSGHSELILN